MLENLAIPILAIKTQPTVYMYMHNHGFKISLMVYTATVTIIHVQYKI
jgi:hypothetical protein